MGLLYRPRLKFNTEAESLSVNGYPVHRYRHVYDAEAEAGDDPFTLETDALAIKRGDRDDLNPQAYVDHVRIVRNATDDARPIFLFHVSTRTDFEETTDPRTDPAQIEWYSQAYQGLSTRDRHGKVIFNSAGSLFKFSHDDAYWIARITKNVTQTPYDLFDYENALNDADIEVDDVPAKKETLRCNGIRISSWRQATVGGNRVWYRSVTFLLIHKREGWLIKKDNVGFEQLVVRPRPRLIERVIEANQTTGARRGRRQIQLVPEIDGFGTPVYENRAEREPIEVPEGSGQRPFVEQVLDRQGQHVKDPRPEDVFQLEIDYYRPLPFSNLPGIGDSPRPRGQASLPNFG